MRKQIAMLLMAATALLGGTSFGAIGPILAVTGSDSRTVSFHLTAGTQATVTGFTVLWADINGHPLGTCDFVVGGTTQCASYSLQPGQFADFTIGTIVNTACQIYPPNTDGLQCYTTYRFYVRLHPPYDDVRSNNAIQSTQPCL